MCAQIVVDVFQDDVSDEQFLLEFKEFDPLYAGDGAGILTPTNGYICEFKTKGDAQRVIQKFKKLMFKGVSISFKIDELQSVKKFIKFYGIPKDTTTDEFKKLFIDYGIVDVRLLYQPIVVKPNKKYVIVKDMKTVEKILSMSKSFGNKNWVFSIPAKSMQVDELKRVMNSNSDKNVLLNCLNEHLESDGKEQRENDDKKTRREDDQMEEKKCFVCGDEEHNATNCPFKLNYNIQKEKERKDKVNELLTKDQYKKLQKLVVELVNKQKDKIKEEILKEMKENIRKEMMEEITRNCKELDE
ncbi:hypothetical protein EIN_507220 [Entamoeba invadens IP1]|uniref:CCHC-type domain-containing protein n=1 Tax=Entamoeba invadens IP1 TaxID=370355 RepID=A0A0A1UFP9_ENTIV|nr:hypothetical protein EIN_507220 [Entamoeba invadens IP1]ELP92841.1 hypothetical protein EIN_507220 [Entamoeba invadens IP1]|eukprot:XP_004259612.1 hypothetical protein EIN_507220 [Entamoeba invadens IP1]